MVFSTTLFLCLFLPLFLLAYELTPKKYKNHTLLAASLLFYWWGAPKFIFVLIGFSAVNYAIVNALAKQTNSKRRKALLVLSIALNLSLLAVFKYANFFVESLNAVLQTLGMTALYWKQIALPIGISFFIFQSITYSVDVFRKDCKRAKNYANYLLYIIAFPQLIAGPMVRYRSIAAQIEAEREVSYGDRLAGFYRFSIGLAKKAVIANFLAAQSDLVFARWVGIATFETMSTPEAWLGVIAFTFQIYFDFSGYSDMAIGLGRMLGFHYPENFDRPYCAKSVSEFWKRWHITLGDFMKNYLYIPLGGNRTRTKARRYLNLWIVFLLSGLWHGAAWNFVFWGAFHGFFLVLDKLGMEKLLKRCGSVVSIMVTFLIVSVGWSLFAVDSMDKWWLLIQTMFSFRDLNLFMIDPIFVPICCIGVFFSFAFALKPIDKVHDFFFCKNTYSTRQHICFFVLSILLFTLSLAHISADGFNPFIYFRF